jgi:hypothetical protein
MFPFAARTAASKASYVIAFAGGGAVVTIPRSQQLTHCKDVSEVTPLNGMPRKGSERKEISQASSLRSMPRMQSERRDISQVSSLRRMSRRGSAGGCSVDMAKSVVRIFHAENSVEGKINLRKNLTFDQAKHMLIAAGAKPKEWKAILDSIDMDSSKSIEFIELVAFLLARSAGTLRDKASLFYHACDIDDSQAIEASVLKEVVHQMMLSKKDIGVTTNFIQSNPILCAGIPESYVAHMRANQMVSDIFTNVSKNGKTVSEKEFQTWLIRGGKQVNQLCSLFGL